MNMADIDAVTAIERDSFSVPWPRDSFVRELTVNRTTARYIILERGGQVVGYAGVWLVLDEGHITNVAVRRDHRGMGGGLYLVQSLIICAVTNGLRFMTLEVRRSNTAAQALYRKCGFIDIGYRKRYYEDNREDALVMTCVDPRQALAGFEPDHPSLTTE